MLEYLSKKGYKRTEATLRKESEEHDPITGLAMNSKKPDDAEVINKAYGTYPIAKNLPSLQYTNVE